MTVSDAEVAAMRRAIELSARGLGSTSPNPPVGCVILDAGGAVVGEGFHERKGEPHAEVHALTAAGARARGGTAVVTLEPCNHTGRTPPCRQALLDAGVRRVVVGVLDPTSREEGGVARLRAAGVSVELGVLADEVRAVLGPWLHAQATGRPHIDRKHVDPDGGPGVAELITGLRGRFDAVVFPNGHIEEGRNGAHPPDVFILPQGPVDLSEADLQALYRDGVRSLLVLTELENAGDPG